MNHNLAIKTDFYRILSSDEVEAIHGATISLLEKTGISVQHQGGLRLLEAAGAPVDKGSQRVKIPEELVERCLATAPEKIVLAGRNPKKDLIVEHGRLPVARNGGGSDYTLDLDTDERRPLYDEDLKNYVRLMDGLEHIDFIAPVYAQDFPVPTRDIRVLETLFQNTDKHVHMRAYSKKSLKVLIEMAVAVAGSEESLKKRPVLSLLEAPISPLIFPEISVDALYLCGQYGIPLEWCCMPIAGGTGPMSLAGNVVLANAEFLGGLVISQLATPGAPFEYAPRCMIMDMKTTVGLTGTIEGAMMAAAGAQLAREKYHVPVSLHGPWTDSIIPDGQSDLERMHFTLIPGLAGANVFSGAGMIEQGKTFSFEQLVIDDDIHGMVKLALGRINTDEDHLALESIDRVGPGGNFLVDDLTLKYLREERFFPMMMVRSTRQAWEAKGAKNLRERAKDKVRQILSHHQPPSLDQDVSKEISALVSAAEISFA